MPQKKPDSSTTEVGDLATELRALRLASERQTDVLNEFVLLCAGMVDALRHLRTALHLTNSTNIELATASRETAVASREMANELAALRVQRAKSGNGHAKDDDLTDQDGSG